MYNENMKMLIKYALELDIDGIRTFDGYLGGDILAFKSTSRDTITKIKNFCHKLETNTNIKADHDRNEFEIFCEFGIDRFAKPQDDIIYDLKPN